MKHNLIIARSINNLCRLCACFFLISFLGAKESNAQVQYTPSVLTGQTYTTLGGGGITVINTTAGLTSGFGNSTQDDGGVLIILPFTFTYNANTFTQMSMSCNGWIGCGNQSTISAIDSRTPANLFNTTIPNNTIAAWFKDMGGNFPLGSGSMRHGLIGTDVYAFQWDNAIGSGFTDNSSILISFQVNIYGPSSSNPGRIEYIYGPSVGAIVAAASIGLEDATGGTGHYLNALNGTTNTTTTSSAWPGNGSGYRFDPSGACVPPSTQPTSLNVTPVSTTQINGSFTGASGADSYLVVRYPAGSAATNPVDGTTYTAGAALGAGTVISSAYFTTFQSPGLSGNTAYDFYVYSKNSYCSGLTYYRTISPLTATATTNTPAIPSCVTGYSPVNATTNISVTPVLSWNAVTSDPPLTGYDVYFSTNPTLVYNLDVTVRVASSQAGTTYTPPTLSYNTAYYWTVIPRNTIGPATSCNITSFATHTPTSVTSTTAGGLWSSGATWAGGAVPQSVDNAIIADGAIVTIDQAVTITNLTIGEGASGVLQWNATSNALTVTGNVLVNSGGSFLPYTTAQLGITLNIGGNFTNNGFANLALSSTILNFNGSQQSGGSLSQTLGGTGNFYGGIIRQLKFQTTGSSTINTSANLIVTENFTHSAGSLNTNGKLSIDNTAVVFGSSNTQIASVAVTNMGSGYTSAPVIAPASSSNWVSAAGVGVGAVRVFGSNIYVATVAGTTAGAGPSHSSGTASDGTVTWLWVGNTGTPGIPFGSGSLTPTVGTQYFYGTNLYTCVTAGTISDANPPVHVSGVVASGGASFLYAGSAAHLTVNHDATTQTLRSLTLTNPGSGYISAPALVVLNTGAGSGAGINVVLIQQVLGPLNSTTIKSSVASISGGINIKSDQSVGALTTTNGGVNYSSAPDVGFSLPTAFKNLVTAGGSGYTAAPSILISGGTQLAGGSVPTFTVTVSQGKVVSVICVSGGSLWTSLPTINITGGGGTGALAAFPAGCLATATATLANGSVTGYTITNGGSGYVTAPAAGMVATGSVTTAAATPVSRIGLYNLSYTLTAPATGATNVIYSEGAEIPTNRRINNFIMNSSAGAAFSGNLELYASTPMTLSSGILDFGTDTLTFSHLTVSTVSASVTSNVKGNIRFICPGGSFSRTFPFQAPVSVSTGTGSGSSGSTIVALNGSRINSPPIGTVSSGTLTGVRQFRLQSNGGIYGTSPTVTLNYNFYDSLTSDQASLFIAQAASSAGPWTIRSTTSGAAGTSLTATGSKVTATSGAGPIVPTGDDYFAWASTYTQPSSLSYDITRTTDITYTSILGTGSNFSWNSTSTDDAVTNATTIPSSTFQFQGETVTGFNASTNGWIKLITATSPTVTAASYNNQMSSTTTTLNTGCFPLMLAPFWDDLATNPNDAGGITSLNAHTKYQIIGSTPGSRKIVVEWYNYTVLVATGPQLNFQVVLDEADNSITYNYGLFQGFNGTNNHEYTYSVGIAGSMVNPFPLPGQVLAQQYENTTAFSNENVAVVQFGCNGLASIPTCNSSLKFTPGVYAGFTPPSPTPPSNDEYTGAITVPALLEFPGNLCGNFYTSRFATASSQASCGGNKDDDVWFKFVDQNPSTTVRVYGSGGYVPRVQVLDSALVALSPAHCEVGSAGGVVNANLAGLIVGATYYVRVYHDGGGVQATATANIIPNGPVTSVTITNGGSGYTTTTTGTNLSARIRFSGGGGKDATGSAMLNGTAIGSIAVQGGYGYTSPPTVYIESPAWAQIGEFALVVYSPPPANDECSQAINLVDLTTPGCTLDSNSANGNTVSATASAEAVTCALPDDDVWYKFTAVNTKTTITVSGTGFFDPAFQVYNAGVAPGNCIGKTSVSCVNASTGAASTESSTVTTIVGNTYLVRVYHALAGTPFSSTFNICVSSALPACILSPVRPVNGGNACASGVSLAWPKSSDATGYKVYLNTGSGPAVTLIATKTSNTDTTFSVTTLVAGAYSWRVEPTNAIGSPTGCTDWTFTAVIPPSVTVIADPQSSSYCTSGSVTLTASDNKNAVRFDGSDDFINGPNDIIPVTGQFTVAVWAKQVNNHAGSFRNIFAQGRNLYLGQSTTGEIRIGDAWPNTGVTFPTDNQWHYYTVVRMTSDTRLYIDGTLMASKGSSIPSPDQNSGGQVWPHNLIIGSQWQGGNEVFDGDIDELQVWNVVRTQAEIQSAMGTTLSSNMTGLVAYYKLDEGVGTVAANAVTGGDEAILNNGPVWVVPSTSPVGGTGSGGATYSWSPATGLNATTGNTVVASPSSTTTYTVSASLVEGCVVTASRKVTVNQPLSNVSIGIVNNASTYNFTTSTGHTLASMTGATQISGVSNDDTPTSVASIGFTFKFEGVNYTSFCASPDGWIKLGTGTAANQFTNSIISSITFQHSGIRSLEFT